MADIISDILARVSDKTNVNDSYGRKSTTVCDVVVTYSNGMSVILPIRATLSVDKDTQEKSIVIGPSTRIKSYGADVIRFDQSNTEQEETFAEMIMEHVQVWTAYASLQQKAIDRLTTSKAAAKTNGGRLVFKVPAKSDSKTEQQAPAEQPVE